MIYVIILIIFMIFLVFMITSSKKDKYKAKILMTDNEFEFFNRLIRAVPEYYVFSQVSMGALLDANSNNPKIRNSIRMTFSQKIIDYVIYDKNKKIVVIIELDDKTHDKEKDKKRDAMLHQAGYKTLRFESKKKPSVEILRKIIMQTT